MLLRPDDSSATDLARRFWLVDFDGKIENLALIIGLVPGAFLFKLVCEAIDIETSVITDVITLMLLFVQTGGFIT